MSSSRLLVATALVVLTALPLAAAPVESVPVDCPITVVRAHFTEAAAVDRLVAWTEPWEVNRAEGWVLLEVDAAGWAQLLADGFEVEVDEALTRWYCTPRRLLKDQRAGIPSFPCYRTVEETHAAAAALAAAHPHLATVVDVGDSWERTTAGGAAGYDLLVLKLTNDQVAGTPTGVDPPHGKPRLLITGAIHAREYGTAELALRFAEWLVDNHDLDADATWLLDEHEVHILLQTNPDGRKLAEAGDLWRKNTDSNDGCSDSSSWGVDLNRNFEYRWGCCGGSDTAACGETYRGPLAASEPEAAAVEAYARAIFPDQKGVNPTDPAATTATGVYLDLHSAAGLVLWPWGYVSTVAPNGLAMQTLGRRLAFFNGYEPDQAVGLYVTDGTTCDFGYGELGVASFVYELSGTFFEPCASFESTIVPDNLPSLIYLAKVARTPYLTPSGPRVTAVESPSGTVVAPGVPVTARVVVDDLPFSTLNGSEATHNIAAAELSLDAPPWQLPAPTPLAMAASDGAFDEKTETVEVAVPTGGLADGRHILYFRGQDASGSWGAVSAAFFWVVDPATAPHLHGLVRDAVTLAPLAATVTAGGFSTTSDPVTGVYDLMVPPGTYAATASAAEHAPATATGLVLSAGAVTTRNFLLAPYTTVLADDVETGNLGWTAQSPWAITTEAAASPTHSWTDSPGSSYTNDRDASLTSALLDLSTLSAVSLEFRHTYATESGYDYCHLEISSDGGGSWAEVASWDGTQASWQLESFDLSALAGAAQARIRFRLTSDYYLTADGWHVDDIVLRGAAPVPTDLLFADSFESASTGAWSQATP